MIYFWKVYAELGLHEWWHEKLEENYVLENNILSQSQLVKKIIYNLWRMTKDLQNIEKHVFNKIYGMFQE